MRNRWARASLLLVLLTALAAAFPGSAGAFSTGFAEDDYLTADAEIRDRVFDRTVQANAEVVRFDIAWSRMVRARPVSPADPADPAYDFSLLDAGVRAAAERDLEPLISISRAPAFAEGPDRPAMVRPGAWKPDPAVFADFATAVARRYSGSFAGLPRVRHFQAWNEPNLDFWLAPQVEGEPFSPGHYREMLNAFYAAVKAVHADNQVVTGGTAPYGDPDSTPRMRPLRFLRALLCLSPNLKRRTCDETTNFDILDHHPINALGGPNDEAIHRDDASTPDLGKLRRTLRAAERAGTVGGGRHPLWATELWWETNPPDTDRGRTFAKQARWIQLALYLIWKEGADVALNFQVHDQPYDPDDPQATLQSGIYLRNGMAKRSAGAFAFPFVTERRSKEKVFAWGKAPVAGKLRIQRRAGGGWRTIAKRRVGTNKVFTKKLRIEGAEMLRARVKGQTSDTWRQRAH